MKIVLTGGPCAGKTSALEHIKEHFTKLGYAVFVVPETATRLFQIGLSPELIGDLEFQRAVLFMQDAIEAVMDKNFPNSLVIYDRGLLDGQAFVTEEKWDEILFSFDNVAPEELLPRYDAVVHLTSIASTHPHLYTTENTPVRRETAGEAAAVDIKTVACWQGHTNHTIIPNYETFQEKLDHLITHITSLVN